jgi:autotransporter-associated beta strand protein
MVEPLEERTLFATGLTGSAAPAGVLQTYGQLPLRFEVNQGQTDPQVNYLAHGSGYTLFLTPAGAVLRLLQPAPPDAAAPDGSQVRAGDVLDMALVGSNPAAAAGLDQLPGTSNYLIGNDPRRWQTGVANYGRVEYQDVYPGVNLVYYGNQQQLEYDFTVAPGADPGAIRLAFRGADGVTLDGQGELVLHTTAGDVVEHAPLIYQEAGGVRQAVSGRYVLEDGGQVGFQVDGHDPGLPLVIDPVLSYATYLGGNDADAAYGIAVDSSGNVYLAGDSFSTHFPVTPGAFQTTHASDGSNDDAFVAKLNPAGTALVYCTYLGGNGGDVARGIAVDSAGNAYVAGSTSSTNFPLSNAFQGGYGGNTDAFVARLNPTGTGLVYASYLGGSNADGANAVAVDNSGNAYVVGFTYSTNFPTTAGAFRPNHASDGGNDDAFVARVSAGGSVLAYATYLGGDTADNAFAVAVDGSGNAYVGGLTSSTNFPTSAGAFQTTHASDGGNNDAFLAKLNPSGSALAYGTYLGGNNSDGIRGVAVDSSGNAYVAGFTYSTNFPTTAGAFQTAHANDSGADDAFVARVNPAGSDLAYSTYLGGNDFDQVLGVAIDGSGNACVTGNTTSTNFPVTSGAFQSSHASDGGQTDAFVARVNPTGSGLTFASYLGGNNGDDAFGIAVDGSGNAYVAGSTSSTNFPTTPGVLQPAHANDGGNTDAFVFRVSFTSPLVYNAPSDGAAHHYTLRLNGANLELVNNDTMAILVSQALATTTAVQITGASNLNDSLTIDYSFGGFFTVSGGVSFNGGGGSGNDLLKVLGTGTTGAGYTPSPTTPGTGTVQVTSGAQTGTVNFVGLQALDVTGMAGVTLTTPSSNDNVTVQNGTDFATNSIPAVRISGNSGGVTFQTVALFNDASVTLDTGTNDGSANGTGPDDVITISSASQGLQNFTITTGSGNDVVNVNGPVTLAGSLAIASRTIVVSSPITTTGGGTVTFSNSGTLTIASGANISADGAVAQNGGAVSLAANVTTTNDPISISGPVTLTGPVTLSTQAVAGAGDVSLAGTVNGAQSLTLTAGAGNVTLGGAGGGGTALTSLTISSAGNVTAGAVTAGSIFQLSGSGTSTFSGLLHATGAGGLSLTGTNLSISGGLTVDAGPAALIDSGTLSVSANPVNLGGNSLTVANSGAATISSPINGASASVTKSGAGTLALSGANTYGGATTVLGGTLAVTGGAAIPDTSQVFLANTANTAFQVNASETIGSLTGGGADGGNVTVAAGQTLTTGADNSSTTYAGILAQGGATGTLTKTGSGDFSLANAAAGTNVAVQITSGRLFFNSQNAIGSGAITVGGGGTLDYGAANAGSALTLTNLVTLASGANVAARQSPLTLPASAVLPTSGTLNINADDQGTTAVQINAGVNLTGNLTVQVGGGAGSPGPALLAGVVGSSGAFGLSKTGPGTLQLAGANSYSGPSTLQAGTLLVNNANGSGTGSGNVVVNGGSLGGNGSLAGSVAVHSGGTLSPSNSPGVLSTGSLTLDSGSTFNAELGGTAPGQYDQDNVTGTVAVNGPTLRVSTVGGFTPGSATQQSFVLLSNDGSDPVQPDVAGTATGAVFQDGNNGNASLLEGAPVAVTGSPRPLYISYRGGDGNDVVLNTQPVVNGSAGGDTLLLRQAAGDPTHLEYSLNGAAFVRVASDVPFTFNGDGGDDTLIVDFVNGSAIPTGGIFFDGGSQAGRDVLVVRGTTTQTATCNPDPATPGKGQVAIKGLADSIHFINVEALDVCQMAQVNLGLPNANDTVTIANGTATDPTLPSTPALTVTGNSGGTGFVPLNLYGDTTVNYTSTLGGTDLVTINGASAGNNASLTVNTGTQAGDMVTVAAGATVNLAGSFDVHSTTIDLNTSNPIQTGGTQTWTGAVVLGADTTLASTGSGNINLADTVNGAFSLTVNTSGATTLGGAVGGTTALTSFTTDAAGTTALNGGSVTTSGAQSYNDAVTLGANATLTSTGSGNVTLAGTVNGAFSLTVITSGATTLGGAVGGSTAPTSLTTDGGGSTALNGGTVTTTGAQTYNDAISLGANTTLTSTGSGNVTLASSVDGAFSLTVNTGGTTALGGAVGGSTALTGLTTDAPGRTALNGGAVTTTGAQTYNDAVTLEADTTLTSIGSGSVTLASTVNGAFGLTVNTGGTTTFGGVVGGSTALTTISTDAPGSTALNGGNVTTSAAQTYNDALTLGADTVLTSTGSGNVRFASMIDGEQALTVAAGTGNVTLTGAVGGGTPLTRLAISSAGNVTAGAVTAGSIAQLSGSGTSTFAGLLHATGAGGLNLTGTNVNLSGGLTVDTGPAALTDSGSLSVSSAPVNLGGNPLAITNSGAATIAVPITGSGGSLVKNGSGTLTLSAASTFSGATTVSGGTLTVNGSLYPAATPGVVTLAGTGVILNGTGTINGQILIAAGSATVQALTVNHLPAGAAGITVKVGVAAAAVQGVTVLNNATSTGILVQAAASGVTLTGNTITGQAGASDTSTGILVSGLSGGTASVNQTQAAVLNNVIHRNNVGIDVRDATALVQGNDLDDTFTADPGTFVTGLQIDGGAVVDAGQLPATGNPSYGNFTGLGISRGNNSFAGYTPFGQASGPASNPAAAQAIRNLNGNGPNGSPGPQQHGGDGTAGAFADLTAQNNTFGSASTLTAIEGVIYHDQDNSGVGFVLYGPGTGNGPPPQVVFPIHYYASDPSEGTANDAALGQTATGQKSIIRQVQITFNGPATFDQNPADPNPALDNAFSVQKLNGPGANGVNGYVTVTVTGTQVLASGQEVVTLGFSGGLTEFGSLVDGNYQLLVNGSHVHNASGTMTGNVVETFWRLYGDVLGNRSVNDQSLTLFRQSLRSTVGSPNYHNYFDFDNNGVIDANDSYQIQRRYHWKLNPDGTISPA